MKPYLLLRYLQKTKWISRRDFDEMIKWWTTSVNWEIVTSFDKNVNIWDKITINLPWDQIFEETIRRFPTFRPIMVVFNKPKWCTVSKDDKYNKTIYDYLPESWRKDFYYIWRLDKDSHWLLLLTNQPDLVDYYENPKNRIFKIYEVEIDKAFKTKDIAKSKKWLMIDEQGKRTDRLKENDFPIWDVDELKFYDIHYYNRKGNHILRIVLKEWKKRHIRRLLTWLWYNTLDLMRIKMWKYELGNIKSGKYMISKI